MLRVCMNSALERLLGRLTKVLDPAESPAQYLEEPFFRDYTGV